MMVLIGSFLPKVRIGASQMEEEDKCNDVGRE